MMTSSLQHAACKLADQLIWAANQVEVQLCSEERGSEDTSYQTAMHACFNLGFEVHMYNCQYVCHLRMLVGEANLLYLVD